MIGNVPVPFGGTAPLRSRFGISIHKVYGADARLREHRANMFRSGVLPVKEPSSRVFAKIASAISGFFLLFALPGMASGNSDATGWALILGAVITCACWLLLRKQKVVLPAVNPFDHDLMLRHFEHQSEPMALYRLSYDLNEDVYVRAMFQSVDFDLIPEVLTTPNGFGLDPFESVLTVHFGQSKDGHSQIRFGIYRMHHIFANKRGLAYVQTEWNFIEDKFTNQGAYPEPRVVDMNQWMWRTIENLQVGEHEFTIQTIGANKVHLPYIGTFERGSEPEPGAYDWYFNTTAGRRQRAAWRNGAQPFRTPPGQAPPLVNDPWLRQHFDELERQQRERAITFVNTVNSLRNEWEDVH